MTRPYACRIQSAAFCQSFTAEKEVILSVPFCLALQDSFDEFQQQFEKEMKKITLEKIIQNYQKRLEHSEGAAKSPQI